MTEAAFPNASDDTSVMPTKCLDRQADLHPHAANRTPQHDAFAIEFYLPHLPVRPGIVGRKTDGQSEGVEPQRAARPGRMAPPASI